MKKGIVTMLGVVAVATASAVPPAIPSDPAIE